MRRQNTSSIYNFQAEVQSPKQNMFSLQRQPSLLQRQSSMSYNSKQIPHQIQPLTNLYPDMPNPLLSPRIPREGSFDSRLKNPLIDKVSPRNIFHNNNGGYPQMNYHMNATPRHHYHAPHQSSSPVNHPRPLPQMIPRLNLDPLKRIPNPQPNGFVMHPPLRLNELERAVAYDMKFEAQIEKQNKMLNHLLGSIAKQEQIDNEMQKLHLQQHLKKMELDRAKYDLELERQQSNRIQRTHIQRTRSRNPSIAEQSKSDVKEVLSSLLLPNNSTLDLKNSLLGKVASGQKSERFHNATNLLNSPGSLRSPSLTPSLTALINSNPKLSELNSPSMRSPYTSKKSIGRLDDSPLRNIEETKSIRSEDSVQSFRLDGDDPNDGDDAAEDSENEEKKSKRKKSKKKKKSSEKKSKRSKKSKNVAFEDD